MGLGSTIEQFLADAQRGDMGGIGDGVANRPTQVAELLDVCERSRWTEGKLTWNSGSDLALTYRSTSTIQAWISHTA
jgi:hypothetical protein